MNVNYQRSSTINFEHFPPHVLDYLDEIYTHRHHKRCINLTYLTLLSMTCAVVYLDDLLDDI